MLVSFASTHMHMKFIRFYANTLSTYVYPFRRKPLLLCRFTVALASIQHPHPLVTMVQVLVWVSEVSESSIWVCCCVSWSSKAAAPVWLSANHILGQLIDLHCSLLMCGPKSCMAHTGSIKLYGPCTYMLSSYSSCVCYCIHVHSSSHSSLTLYTTNSV